MSDTKDVKYAKPQQASKLPKLSKINVIPPVVDATPNPTTSPYPLNQVAPEVENGYSENSSRNGNVTINIVTTSSDVDSQVQINDNSRKPVPCVASGIGQLISTTIPVANSAILLSPNEYNRRASMQVLKNRMGTNRRINIHHKVRSWMEPSESPANLKMFGGQRAVQEEQIRLRKAGLVIHPYSSLRYYWDLTIMMFLLLNLVILPLNIAFFLNTSNVTTWIAFHTISDVLFMSDIVLNFRTGYKEDKNGYRMKFVLEPKLIAKRYMKSWLALDIISSFPFDNFFLLVSGEDSENVGLGVKSASRAFKFLRLAKFLSLLKLLRLSRILRYVSKYEDFYFLTANVMRYIKLVMMMLLVAHWNGCLGFLIPMLQNFPENSWVALNKLQNANWLDQYGWALFKALSHMLCIGYGRFIPQLLSEACITIFSMITGATFYALFIAHSMAYIQQNDSARRQYQEKFQQIEEYMCYRNLPANTRERITHYYEHKYSQKRLFNEREILYEVSQPLREDIVNHNCRDLIESVPFLKEGGSNFITLIISTLSFDVYLAGDLIIKEGAIGNDMYFIRHGAVDILAEDVHVATLMEGDYFGEITMLTDARRVATAKAATVCDLFILNKQDLYRALVEFPEMRVVMEHVALGRLLKLKEKFPESVNTADAHSDLLGNQQTSVHNTASESSSRGFSTTAKTSYDTFSEGSSLQSIRKKSSFNPVREVSVEKRKRKETLFVGENTEPTRVCSSIINNTRITPSITKARNRIFSLQARCSRAQKNNNEKCKCVVCEKQNTHIVI